MNIQYLPVWIMDSLKYMYVHPPKWRGNVPPYDSKKKKERVWKKTTKSNYHKHAKYNT